MMRSLVRSTNFWAAVVLLVLPLIFPEDFFRILCVAAMYAIVALGMSLLLGYAGQISLGHAAFMGIGAYTTALLTTRFDWPVILAFLAAIAVSAVIAFIVGKPILKTKGYFLALATLGFGEIFYVFVSRTDPVIGGLYGIGGVPYFAIFGYEFSSYAQMYYLDWAILMALILYSQNIVNSRPGRAYRAINTDEVAASAMGIDVAGFKLKIFVLSGAYAGIAGSLLATYLSTAQPHGFGVQLSIFVVVAVIVGGTGNLWGTVVAAVFLTWLQDALSRYQEYSTLIYGIILILILIFAPQGLGSLRQRYTSTAKLKRVMQNIKLFFKPGGK
jgi:branched-chain amino acid transport system permease protein